MKVRSSDLCLVAMPEGKCSGKLEVTSMQMTKSIIEVYTKCSRCGNRTSFWRQIIKRSFE